MATLPWHIILFTLGVIGGVLLMIGDAQWLWRQYQLYVSTPERPVLLTRSLLFLVAFWPLALFVVTTGSNPMGQGVIIGMGGILCWELWQKHSKFEVFKSYFGIPAHSKLTQRDVTIGVICWLVLFIAMCVAVVW